ncbi:hypothetical protein [Streptomyces sp. NPDC058240]|uniref:hypothetical protein n=1 Tax=Streptomyces sp. NPDC058240 TaxID=3346396 RepID=UPI0036E62BA3
MGRRDANALLGSDPAHQNHTGKAMTARATGRAGKLISEFCELGRISDQDAFHVHIRS